METTTPASTTASPTITNANTFALKSHPNAQSPTAIAESDTHAVTTPTTVGLMPTLYLPPPRHTRVPARGRGII